MGGGVSPDEMTCSNQQPCCSEKMHVRINEHGNDKINGPIDGAMLMPK
jgi:hypothetical protein